MSRASLLLAVSAASALSISVSRDARAVGPVDVEVGAIAGAGTQPSNQAGVPNALGFGLGGRGGVTLFGVYGGLEGMYYFGGSNPGGAKAYSELYGVDVGYSLKLPLITIRPLLGIGNFTESAGLSFFGGNVNSTLYLQPGLTALVSLGTIYAGVDANALLLTSLPQSGGRNGMDVACTIHAQLGLRF